MIYLDHNAGAARSLRGDAALFLPGMKLPANTTIARRKMSEYLL
jgi:hypothetical protein